MFEVPFPFGQDLRMMGDARSLRNEVGWESGMEIGE